MNENFNKLAEIERQLEFYSDIPAFLRLYSREIDDLSKFGTLTGVEVRIEELKSEIEKLLKQRQEVEKWILSLPKIQRELLKLRYFEGRNWRQIEGSLQCKGFNLRIRQLQNHKAAAIRTIAKNYEWKEVGK